MSEASEGISPASLKRCKEPFVVGATAGKGLGLPLGMEQGGEHTLGSARSWGEGIDGGDDRLFLAGLGSFSGTHEGLGIGLLDQRDALAIGLHNQESGLRVWQRRTYLQEKG